MNAPHIQRILLVADRGKQTCCLVQRAGQLALDLAPQAIDRMAVEETRAPYRSDAAEAVLRTAAGSRADLVVFAAGQRHFLLEWLAPSCALKVMQRSRLPVLLVQPASSKPYRKVVVATDFSPESISAANMALLLAPSAHFVFTHAYRLPDERLMRELELQPRLIALYRERARVAAWKTMRALVDSFAGRGGTTMSCAVEHGAPHRVVEDVARDEDADLIVIGRPFRQTRGWPALGSPALRMIGRPHCDLLVGSGDEVRLSGRRLALERLAEEN